MPSINRRAVRRKDGPQDDETAMAKAQTRYTRLFFVHIPLTQLALSTGTYPTYAVLCYDLPLLGMPSMQATITTKITILRVSFGAGRVRWGRARPRASGSEGSSSQVVHLTGH